MIAKLYHMSLYDFCELLYGWAFGREYYVLRRVSGPTVTTTTNTTLDDSVTWIAPATQWERRRIRFRVPDIAMDGDY